MSYFQAKFDFVGDRSMNQLSLKQGDILLVTKTTNADGWVYGGLVGPVATTTAAAGIGSSGSDHGWCQQQGWFPASYVQACPPPPPRTPASMTAAPSVSPTTSSSSVSSQPTVAFQLQQQTNNQQAMWPTQTIQQQPYDDDCGFGPNASIMGGELSTWNGTNSTSALSAVSLSPSSSTRTMSSSSSSSFSSPFKNNASMKSLSTRMSNAASSTSQAMSNAASKTASAVKSTWVETGHRISDMKQERRDQLDQKEKQGNNTTTVVNYGNGAATTSSSTFTRGDGILPGRHTKTETMKEGNATTVTTTSRASGGFMPYIPGRTTTTQTEIRDKRGNVTHTQTHTSSCGGFTIIPCSLTGLAVVGGIAAYNAVNHNVHKHQDKKQQQQQQQH